MIDFTWNKPESGHRWISAVPVSRRVGNDNTQVCQDSRDLVLVPNDASDKEPYQLDDVNPALYRVFSGLKPDMDSILSFADEYGSLGGRVSNWYRSEEDGQLVRGESLSHWLHEVCMLKAALSELDEGCDVSNEASPHTELTSIARDALQLWHDHLSKKRSPTGCHDALMQGSFYRAQLPQMGAECDIDIADGIEGVQNARLVRIADMLNYNLQECRLQLHWQFTVDKPVLAYVPSSLLGAMWVQLAEELTGARTVRCCGGCGKWFVVDPRSNHVSKHYCNVACRNRAMRQRQAKAKRLFKEDLPIPEIARIIGTDENTVANWVATKRLNKRNS